MVNNSNFFSAISTFLTHRELHSYYVRLGLADDTTRLLFNFPKATVITDSKVDV